MKAPDISARLTGAASSGWVYRSGRCSDVRAVFDTVWPLPPDGKTWADCPRAEFDIALENTQDKSLGGLWVPTLTVSMRPTHMVNERVEERQIILLQYEVTPDQVFSSLMKASRP